MIIMTFTIPAFADECDPVAYETVYQKRYSSISNRIEKVKKKNIVTSDIVNTYKNKHTKKLKARAVKKINNSVRYYTTANECLKKSKRLADTNNKESFRLIRRARKYYKKSNVASNKARKIANKAKKKFLKTQTRSLYWDGGILTRSKGVNYGISGKETYYNLPMNWVVYYMRQRGYSEKKYPVWVRDDGCKMFGDYIMCAANLSEHPYGSLVESSLGTCIVVDTGGFASSNRYQLDIAVTW